MMALGAHQHEPGIGDRQPTSPNLRPGLRAIGIFVAGMVNLKGLRTSANYAQMVEPFVNPSARRSPFRAL
jgi:hypothetical protein